MRFLLRQFWTLAALTALEAVRRPICLLLTTTCIVVTGLSPLLFIYQFGEEGKLVRDSSLALHVFFGILIAGYAACSSLSREIRNGTASAVLSKPVGKIVFFLAKFFGVTAVIVAFSVCAICATLLSTKTGNEAFITDWVTAGLLFAAPALSYLLAALANYFAKRPFVSTAFGVQVLMLILAVGVAALLEQTGESVSRVRMLQWRIIPASLLSTMACVVIAAIAVSLATRLRAVPTLIICGIVFLLGLVSDHFFGRVAGDSRIFAFLYAMVPNWQHFWVADALTGNGIVPWAYVAHVGAYGALYLAGVLSLGILSFRNVEIK